MTRMTLDQMMARMGFPATEVGPYVTELRAVVARQMSEGMVNRSAGTWAAPGAELLSYEERAKALLAWEWELQNAHSFEVKAIDGLHEPRDFRPWLWDRWREFTMWLRIWRDRYILRRVNPYN